LVRGLYTAAAGAVVAESLVDVTANNLANAATLGFKRALLQVESQPQNDLYRFQTVPGRNPLNRLDGVQEQVPVGPLGSGSQIYDTPTNFEQGTISISGNALDFALYGPGFFAVRDAQGIVRYTRDGSFVRNPNNVIQTVAGDTVLDPNLQPIVLPQQGKISSDAVGGLSINGIPFAKIGVFSFRNTTTLRSAGANRFEDNQSGVQPDTSTSVIQGAQEKSNADVVQSIVDLIKAERWFDADEKVIQTEDDATGIAISQVGITQK